MSKLSVPVSLTVFLSSVCLSDLQPITEDELSVISGKAGTTFEYTSNIDYQSFAYKDQDMDQYLALIDGTVNISNLTATLDVVTQIPETSGSSTKEAIALGISIPEVNTSSTLVITESPNAITPDGSLRLHDRSTVEYYRDYLINPNTWSDKTTGNSDGGSQDQFTVTVSGSGAGSGNIDGSQSGFGIIGRYRLNAAGERIDQQTYTNPTTSNTWQWNETTTGCFVNLIGDDCDEADFVDGDFKLTDPKNEFLVLRVYAAEGQDQSVTINYDAPRTGFNAAQDDAVLLILNDDHTLKGKTCRGNESAFCSGSNDILLFDRDGDENKTFALEGDTVFNRNVIFLGNPRNQYLMQTNISGSFNMSGSAYIFAN